MTYKDLKEVLNNMSEKELAFDVIGDIEFRSLVYAMEVEKAQDILSEKEMEILGIDLDQPILTLCERI